MIALAQTPSPRPCLVLAGSFDLRPEAIDDATVTALATELTLDSAQSAERASDIALIPNVPGFGVARPAEMRHAR